jgi:hypothetical protein
MLLHKIARGGVVYDAELACAIGELLLRDHYGADELARQQPLSATAHGDIWRVEGSWNRDYAIEGENGPFFMTIAKFDGGITDFGLWGPKLTTGVRPSSK